MMKIGLTGGIGTGKSTVTNMLLASKFKVIDADLIAREVLRIYPGILENVRREFGDGFFDWRGEFRRKEFGNHIFRFPKQRKKYEEIILPYINKEIDESFKRYEENGEKIVFLDAPTLIENGVHEKMDYVVLVCADTNVQIQRIMSRDNVSRNSAVERINAQMPLQEKKQYANIIINNNGKLEDTNIQVKEMIEFIKKL